MFFLYLIGLNQQYQCCQIWNLYDLLKSYSAILLKTDKVSQLTITLSELHSVDSAIQRLKSIFGEVKEWTNFLSLIPKMNSNKIFFIVCITSFQMRYR